MIIPAPNDIAFNLFGLPIYWYGITMATAIFVAILVANKLYNIINTSIRKDVIIEYAPYIIILGILCARLYFCVLNPSYYFAHPIEILDIREGGLSIHGAIIGGVISMFMVAKIAKVPVMSIFDSLAVATILGQSIGRWGNYFNSEAYGLPVQSQTWGLFIPASKRVSQFMDYSLFHPTFLYESVLDFCVFFILLFVILKFGKKYQGVPFFAYLILYSIIRYFIEQIRVDSALNVGTFPIAEIVSVLLFVIGLIGVLTVILRNSKKSV